MHLTALISVKQLTINHDRWIYKETYNKDENILKSKGHKLKIMKDLRIIEVLSLKYDV